MRKCGFPNWTHYPSECTNPEWPCIREHDDHPCCLHRQGLPHTTCCDVGSCQAERGPCPSCSMGIHEGNPCINCNHGWGPG